MCTRIFAPVTQTTMETTIVANIVPERLIQPMRCIAANIIPVVQQHTVVTMRITTLTTQLEMLCKYVTGYIVCTN